MRRSPRIRLGRFAAVTTLVMLLVSVAGAQLLYKYQGPGGEWIYSDRPPVDGEVDEVRDLGNRQTANTLSVHAIDANASVRFIAENPFHAPVEVVLRFKRIAGLAYPHPDNKLEWVLPPTSTTQLLSLAKLDKGVPPAAEFESEYMLGSPAARHQPEQPYRVPVAISSEFQVTQAYPDVFTHTTLDSRFAVDIAMPIGTDVFAARAGVVFDVASDNFRSGLDPERDGPAANVVRILHDDGTYAVYAHLNWNSIRVRPGDRVVRGEYIADSGNTGFSSGPHLHFVVVRNTGMRSESVPVEFQGAASHAIRPATGSPLTAY